MTRSEIEVRNPATGERIGSVADLGETEVADLVDRARAAQPGWARTGVRHALAFWERHAPRWLADERPHSSSPAVFGRRLAVRYEPHGVVAVIAPWNYPLANGPGDCIPALAAGNSVVLKPSEETPLSALLFERALHESGATEGTFSVATGKDACRRERANIPSRLFYTDGGR